jgi:hypothetical protein
MKQKIKKKLLAEGKAESKLDASSYLHLIERSFFIFTTIELDSTLVNFMITDVHSQDSSANCWKW